MVNEIKLKISNTEYISISAHGGKKGDSEAVRLTVGNGFEELCVVIDGDDSMAIRDALSHMI